MESVAQQLGSLRGRVCLMCVGNPDGGDDALGVRLGEALAARGLRDVVIAGSSPEDFVMRVARAGCDHLIFIDAIDFGAEPGSVVFLSSDELVGRLPQVSTHRISLGLLAKWAESDGCTRSWLLGVQPQSLQSGRALSPAVQAAVAQLIELLTRCFNRGIEVGIESC